MTKKRFGVNFPRDSISMVHISTLSMRQVTSLRTADSSSSIHYSYTAIHGSIVSEFCPSTQISLHGLHLTNGIALLKISVRDYCPHQGKIVANFTMSISHAVALTYTTTYSTKFEEYYIRSVLALNAKRNSIVQPKTF